ncbi:rRNA maturation RNase YbeY [Treponema brennaborense]|uniref:Endoribonuclease YbeY n=1 Tax=Treponema brennaborense (strain DSM 12168 / CIP 105900 / DD5/3) TaxID=906968 RepID=F4LJU0_TREBD|nr:rRNA maturation RNase YbeY [Treponema brennaborense]AEE16420.1 metalloprotease ybeY [Treponema brennaborense DSM 12168]
MKNEANKIEVSVHEACGSPEWIEKIEPFMESVLRKLHITGWEVSVLFCADPFIAELNLQYRSIKGPTDVLSFELGDEYIDEDGVPWTSAGDIVVSIDTLERNALEFGVPVDQELKRLLIHGVLHLSGYDHSDNSPEQEMLVLQESILPDFLHDADIIIREKE